MKYLFLMLLFVLILTDAATAQTQTIPPRAMAEIIAGNTTTIVKGVPFSADAVSESVQTLADGNRISRSFTVKMYRDGEGRFRREPVPAQSNATGALGELFGVQQSISIFDPVANYRYFLEPAKKTARRMSVPAGNFETLTIANGQPLSAAMRTQIETNAVQRTNVIVLPSVAATVDAGKSESLGTRSFDGVEAEGTRTTVTIAAGTIGNERPIEIVYEKWYSKELQLIVYSRNSDPRFGEQTYRLENISRSEPDRSLFQLPSDYKLVAEPVFTTVRPARAPIAPGTVVTTTSPATVTVAPGRITTTKPE